MKKWLLLIFAAVFLVGSFFAYAETQGAGKHDWRHHNMLNLTADQQKRMKTVMKQAGNDLYANKLETKKKEIELAQLLITGNPDRAAVDQKLQEILALKGQKQQTLENAYFNILAFLTPDQRVKFSKFAAEHFLGGRERHRGCDGQWQGHGRMMHPMNGSMHGGMPAGK